MSGDGVLCVLIKGFRVLNFSRIFAEADRPDGIDRSDRGGFPRLQSLLQPGAEGRGQRLHRESLLLCCS